MKKLVFYCHHLLGIGHLSRSLNICENLLDGCEVHFIQGGRDVGKTLDHPHFFHSFLPVIEMDEVSRQLVPLRGTLEACFQERQSIIDEALPDDIDALVIELYPFGRKKFANEIRSLIEKIKNKNPSIPIFCSVRDILVEKDNWDERQDKIISEVKKYFDFVLVHTDHSLVPFSLTFSKVEEIKEKIFNTGFVTENRPLPVEAKRGNRVVVSRGGRQAGDELVKASLSAAKELESIDFTFIRSPKMEPELLRLLDEADENNIEVIEFSKNFEKLLCECSLSVSLGGYNTMMNLLRTKTFGLVWAFEKSSEQMLRSKIFQEQGFLRRLSRDEIQSGALVQLIPQFLNASDWKNNCVDLDGALSSARFILQKIYDLEPGATF